jgi:hypothetical protein
MLVCQNHDTIDILADSIAVLVRCNELRLGRARPVCPSSSDVDLLGDLDCGIADRALDLGGAESHLDRSQISGLRIDQRRLGPTQGAGASLEGTNPAPLKIVIR